MAMDEIWDKYFKAELKNSGLRLYEQEKVAITSGSDRGIEAFVRVSPPVKVRFSTPDIGSASFSADCTCPGGKKERLCKHVWATLLAVAQSHPDFLNAKQHIEKGTRAADAPVDSRNSYQATAKLLAAEYRKSQYQKQKLRAKELKQSKSNRVAPTRAAPVEQPSFPPEVGAALGYFSENGFPMCSELSEASLSEAKRKLSRVFHPDRGGSHDEITLLNKNSELVLRFLRSSTAEI